MIYNFRRSDLQLWEEMEWREQLSWYRYAYARHPRIEIALTRFRNVQVIVMLSLFSLAPIGLPLRFVLLLRSCRVLRIFGKLRYLSIIYAYKNPSSRLSGTISIPVAIRLFNPPYNFSSLLPSQGFSSFSFQLSLSPLHAIVSNITVNRMSCGPSLKTCPCPYCMNLVLTQ